MAPPDPLLSAPRVRRLRLDRYLVVIAAGWTLVLAGSYWHRSRVQAGHVQRVALDVARAAFQKDLAYRRWAARQGGVYVPASAYTPPNPHLSHVPDRDVVTQDGKRLTLVNPAYMTRQVLELSSAEYGVRGHITSLKPLAAEGRPDAWEEAALRRLDAGESEVWSIEALAGAPYLRFIGPMHTEKGCLKCHGHQGYREGDVRGGISVSVPMADLKAMDVDERRALAVNHAAVWLLGLLALGLAGRGLKGRVRDREAAQAEQLRLGQELMRARKLEALGRLSGGIAHDFNNLLTPILGHAQLLAADLPPGSPLREDAEQIRLAAERAAGLTRRLLAFGRPEALRPEAVALHELVAGTAGMLQRLLGETVTMAVRADPAAPRARCDRGQVEMALVNLALNARDAMPGGGTLTVATGAVELPGPRARALRVDPGRYATLEVRDTGVGMTAEVRARLFEPFFTTKGPGQGTGLGLATLHGATRQVGGAVEVESEVGRGTLVRLLLPATEAPAASAAPEEGGDLRGSEAVLIVEDDPAVRRLAAAALASLGYRVREAAGPQEALALPEEALRADLLLSDVVMPGMSGPELWRRYRERVPGAAVLFVSGYPGDGGVGGERLLPKPFAPGDLGRAVRQALDARRAEPVAAA